MFHCVCGRAHGEGLKGVPLAADSRLSFLSTLRGMPAQILFGTTLLSPAWGRLLRGSWPEDIVPGFVVPEFVKHTQDRRQTWTSHENKLLFSWQT